MHGLFAFLCIELLLTSWSSHTSFADVFARCFRSQSWYTLFACQYHTLCSLADFTFFPTLFSLAVLIYRFPTYFRTLCVRFLFWRFWASIQYIFVRTLQTQPRNSYVLFTSRSHAIFRRYVHTLCSRFIHACCGCTPRTIVSLCVFICYLRTLEPFKRYRLFCVHVLRLYLTLTICINMQIFCVKLAPEANVKKCPRTSPRRKA